MVASAQLKEPMRTSRVVGPLVLFAMGVLLTAYVAWLEPRNSSDAVALARKGYLLGDFSRIAVTEVQISGSESGDALWVRDVDAGGWRSSRNEALDAYRVDSLLSDIERAHAIRPTDAAQLGAIRASYVFRIGHREIKLRIGQPATHPQGAVYVETDGHTYVAEGSLARTLLQPLAEVRDRRVVPIRSDELVELSWSGGEKTTLRRRDSLTWTRDDHMRVSRPAVEATLRTLDELRIEAWLSKTEEADARARSSSRTLTMRSATGSFVLHFGEVCAEATDRVLIVTDTVVGCIAKEIADELSSARITKEDPRVFLEQSSDVAEVRIEQSQVTFFDVAREGAGWRVRTNVPHAASTEEVFAIDQWLTDLLQIEGVPCPLPTTNPTHRITWVRGGENFSRSLNMWLRPGGEAVVSRDIDAVSLCLPKFPTSMISRAATYTRSLTALTLDESGQIRLMKSNCSPVEEVVELSGGMHLVSPKGWVLSQARWLDWLALLSETRADRIRDASMPPSPRKARCQMTLVGSGGENEWTKYFEWQLGGDVARMTIDDIAYEYPSYVKERVRRSLADPSCLLSREGDAIRVRQGSVSREVPRSLLLPLVSHADAVAPHHGPATRADIIWSTVVDGGSAEEVRATPMQASDRHDWYATCGAHNRTFVVDDSDLRQLLDDAAH